MPAPLDKVVEVEMVPGSNTWTPITGWVDWSAGVQTKFGRSTPWSDAQPATLSLTLDNTDGRFTPGTQVLNDGTSHPFWPNLQPGRRIRLKVTPALGGATVTRFAGTVKGWPPGFKDISRPRVQIDAVDILGRLSRLTLQSAIAHEVFEDGPTNYWPLTDNAGSTFATPSVGSKPLTLTANSGGNDPVVFGSNGPGAGDGSGVSMQPTGRSTGQILLVRNTGMAPSPEFSVEAWVNPGTSLPAWAATAGYMNAFVIDDGSGTYQLQVGTNGAGAAFATAVGNGLGGSLTGPSIIDGGWHHMAINAFIFSGRLLFFLYVDGVVIGNVGWLSSDTVFRPTYLAVGDWGSITGTPARSSSWQGGIGQVAIYPMSLKRTNGSKDSDMTHYRSGTGWFGETVTDRLIRLLGYAGLADADMLIDSSDVVLGSYAQAGQDVLTACLDAARAEGGGAALYARPDGIVKFIGRAARAPGAPAATIDAAGDMDGDAFQVAFTVDDIVNSYDLSRATESGGQWSTVISDDDSITAYEKYSDSISTNAASNDDVLRVGQAQLAQTRQPLYRIPQVPVDLWTSQTAGLDSAVWAALLSARLRIINLPRTTSPIPTRDVIVEGFGDVISDSGYTVTFDTSPADVAPWLMLDDPVNGRWQASGQTLDTGLIAAATTVIIDTPAGLPTFTTAPSSYPLTIVVGVEHIRLNAPPSGSASPQTFTGVTRGVDGTAVAVQPAGSPIQLYPTSTWTL